MLLLFIRHGEVYSNLPKGKIGDGRLTPRGKKQIDMVAKRLQVYKPDVIYCSALDRARLTALEIKKYHPRVKLFIKPGFNEISGMIIGKENTSFPRDKKIEHIKRADKMFNMMKKWKYGTAIVVAHGNIIDYFLCKFMGVPTNNGIFFRIDNTSVTGLVIEKGKTRMILMNGRKHLPPRLINGDSHTV